MKRMQRSIVVMVMVLSCVGFTLPVMALEVDFSGEFYVEGILNSSENMLDSDKTSDYRQMRLRVRNDFRISDNLSLVTRFDALEKVLSSNDSAFDNGSGGRRFDEDVDDDNIDFDRAYISYISPIGLFQLGRMQGVTWGTSFADDESDTDRIKYILPIPMGQGKLYIVAVAEKVTENDKGSKVSDLDNDKFYIGVAYKTPDYATGLLTAMYNFKKFQDPGQRFATANFQDAYDANGSSSDFKNYVANTDGASDSMSSYGRWYTTGAMAYQAAYIATLQGGGSAGDARMAGGTAAVGAAGADWLNSGIYPASAKVFSERGQLVESRAFLLAPYFKGKFGDWGVEAELDYVFGTSEYDVPGAGDRDINAFGHYRGRFQGR